MSFSPNNANQNDNIGLASIFNDGRFLLMVILLTSLNVALADSSKEPIQINADHAESDEVSGQTIYRGNVIIEQGSLLLRGNQVIVNTQNKNDNITTKEKQRRQRIIEATGEPAFFHQLDDSKSVIVKAEANRIEYFVESGVILLQENATIDQAGYIITGDEIEYSTLMQSIKAKADPKNTNTRVHTVIKPKSSNEDEP